MKLEFIELKLKNFLSFGNVEQVIKLNTNPYTIITGFNKDISNDDSGNKNGVGKSSIFNALHYALFGRAIGNKVTLPNLVNNINKKHMEVSLTFKKNDVLYTIERGRSPNYLRFYKDEEEITDESLGDSRDTQSVIEEIIGMNEELFNQTIMLSCGVPIFMNQSTSNQKLIIEKVLGVDVITDKINKLKEVIKETKNNINNEEFKITTLKNQQETLKNDYENQITNYKQQKQLWYDTQETEIKSIKEQIDKLKSIDYDKELRLINETKDYLDNLSKWQNNEKTKQGLISSINREQQMLENINRQINTIDSIDFDKELEIINYNEDLKKKEEEYKNELSVKQQLNNRYNELSNGYITLCNEKKKVQEKIEKYQSNLCPTCGQVLDKEKAEQEVNKLTIEMQHYDSAMHQVDIEILETNAKLSECVEDGKIFDYQRGRYSNIELLNIDKNKSSELNASKLEIVGRINELNTELRAYDMEKPNEPSEYSQFMTINEYYESKSSMDGLNNKLNTVKTQTEPYSKLISELESKLNSIEPIDESLLKDMLNEQEHNNVLLKLLNAPNSYIRQSILDKSLSYLNTKIKQYLEQLGSTISVKFNSDMTIDMRRRGLDLGYVSSGEEGRIAIALTLAFRDTWESLSGIECNLLMVDELLDKIGLDVNGKQMMVKCLRHIPNRNIFLVSHDVEINTQGNKVLTIVKEKNFSNVE